MFKFFKKIYILLVTVPFFIVVSVQFYGRLKQQRLKNFLPKTFSAFKFFKTYSLKNHIWTIKIPLAKRILEV